MSLDPLWAESLQKATTKHFHNQDVGLPWDLDNSDEEQEEQKSIGPKVSLTFLEPSIMKINREEYLASFKIRLVCTIAADGIYDLSTISGKVALLLLEDINAEYACIEYVLKKVEIEYFDFAFGYKQSLMVQQYTSRLRG